jgi:hypothetical protein
MSNLARKLFGEDLPAKRLALLVDLDETVCTSFLCPIAKAVEVLVRLDRQKIEVHYVTARTEVSREGTDRLIADNKLPGWRNVHFCPKWMASRRHKVEVHAKLAKEYQVIASIGDTDEEEGVAARLAGVAFVLVDRDDPIAAWVAVAELIEAAGGFTT